MDKSTIDKILQARKNLGKPFEITVAGISMNPMLYEGDVVTIQPQEDYNVGDILVFTYKYGELLVHRLLDIKDGRYFCKGDNALRLEDITKDKITGKVILIKRDSQTIPVPECSGELVALSKEVGREFFRCRYDAEKTRESDVYKEYKKLFSE